MWDVDGGARPLMEVGFSCMGGEIPGALGVRMGDREAGEVYVLIGDGTYLMGGASELVTARQEGLKLIVLVVVNRGYQSIHGLQERTTGRSFGLGFVDRAGAYVDVDYAANARSLGCAAYGAATPDELRRSLDRARGEERPVVIVVDVEPRRYSLDPDCWWDVGVASVSDRAETRRLAAEYVSGRSRQRYLR